MIQPENLEILIWKDAAKTKMLQLLLFSIYLWMLAFDIGTYPNLQLEHNYQYTLLTVLKYSWALPAACEFIEFVKAKVTLFSRLYRSSILGFMAAYYVIKIEIVGITNFNMYWAVCSIVIINLGFIVIYSKPYEEKTCPNCPARY